MEDPFDGITPAKKDELEDSYPIRSLTDNFVFCPKCGHRNTFELSKTGTQLVYFCMRCSAKLNAYWDSHLSGEITIANCKSCQQKTFKDLKYCISCGLQRKTVAAKRIRGLSRPKPEFDLDKIISQAALDCCTSGPCILFLGPITTKSLKRLPKIYTYICLIIALAGLAFIIAMVVIASGNLW